MDHFNPRPKAEEAPPKQLEWPIIKTIQLPPIKHFPAIPFLEVIQRRRSVRNFDSVDIETLSAILWHSAKVQVSKTTSSGINEHYRPVPSAGARHPIEIIVSTIDENGTHPNWEYYDPHAHSLALLDLPSDLKQEFMQHIREILPFTKGVILWFLADIERTAAKYENPMSLVWRDAGALILAVQLTCTAMNVNSCPLGTLGEPFISEMFGNIGNMVGVGGMIIG
jgi:SagB-type dehydrogenase family enzyme